MRGRAGIVGPGFLPILIQYLMFKRHARDLIRIAILDLIPPESYRGGENFSSDMTRADVD
jgi:hypothetical protein